MIPATLCTPTLVQKVKGHRDQRQLVEPTLNPVGFISIAQDILCIGSLTEHWLECWVSLGLEVSFRQIGTLNREEA